MENKINLIDKYYYDICKRCNIIHEATDSFFATDVKAIMDNLNYIPAKKFDEIRYQFYKLYGRNLMDVLCEDLTHEHYSIIERRIIPYPESPLLCVILGILTYAGIIYLLLHA